MIFRRITTYLLLFFAIVSLCCSCNGDASPSMENPKRSVYYWRTSFSLSKDEKAFLTQHGIERLYLHLFDVVDRAGKPVPNATLLFEEQVPAELDVVPVVFINQDVIRNDTIKAKELASLISNRVSQMMDSHKVKWNELQIDFDWTQRNQSTYFVFLRALRDLLSDNQRGISSTIRLHQLALSPPPVDYGALMVYNIGDYSDSREENSILSTSNLKPYIKYLADYKLPITTALPIYSWNLAFQNSKFMGIARGININDTATYSRVTDSKCHGDIYVVKRYHTSDNEGVTMLQPGLQLTPGCIIRHEECSSYLLQDVYDIISHQRRNALDQVILYHLDNKNLNQYNYEQIETLFDNH